MVVYDRGDSAGARVAEFDDAITWIAHPDEEAKRASHAIRTDEGVWVIDPIDAPGIDEAIEDLGAVVGVAVLTCWHARDAGVLARRHDVAVHVPEWLDRIEERVEAPVERYALAPGTRESGFHTIPCRPFPRWQEAFLYHEPSATLVAPDSLGTSDLHLVGEERLGLAFFRRLQPPRQLAGLEPDRILVGHGEPIADDAAGALDSALTGTRRTFPTALLENGPDSLRSIVSVLRG